MSDQFLRFEGCSRFSLSLLLSFFLCLAFASAASAQVRPPENLGPPLRPAVKMTGLVNAPIAATETRPVVMLAVPGHKERYKFLVTDMKLLAGPLRTPSDILAEVKPYTTSFYLRGPKEAVSRIVSAAPTDEIAITAEYSRNGRLLFVDTIEKVEEAKK